ncbi:EAL domain-containing protein [Nocardioides mangrovicus]|uniref:EAL domain-containing protein n=2 Tax=Nocardioides mangrovicus TaxID=2478913 RepID=A0A3L8NYN5_9ACTN|nr:EAL domain-containing protein [Nocardioides mangrovicus]
MRALFALLLGAVVALPALPAGPLRDVVALGAEIGCVAIGWRGLRSRPDLMDKGWPVVVGGISLAATADVLNGLERHLLHLQGPLRPSVLVLLVGYGVLAVGVYLFDHRRIKVTNRRGHIEAAIFALGGLAPVLVFVILPQTQAEGPLGARLAVAGFALADLGLITVVARLLLTDSTRSMSLLLLSAAVALELAGDFASSLTSITGDRGDADALVQALWLLGYVFFAAGMVHPSLRDLTYGTSVDAERVSPRSQVLLLATGLLLPGASVAISLLLGRATYLWVLTAIGLLVSALVALRIMNLMGHIGEQSDQLAQLARSDELTRLPNRRSWNHAIGRACDVAAASQAPLCVALFDLDRFKEYNDNHGHPAGDALLRQVSALWSAALVEGEIFARYGGEEFAMLLPGLTLPDAVDRADQLRRLVPLPQSASVGVAAWRPGTDPALTLAEADEALYLAKRAGRARTVAAESSVDAMPGPLRDQVVVVQPIVRLADLAVIGHECLSRFPHTTDIEAVFADAHGKGYGDLLEAAAIRRVLERDDRRAGTDVYVNVSELAMHSDRFWLELPRDLTGVVVELSEHQAGLEDAAVADLLDRMRERGARVGLDDVGSQATDFARMVALRPEIAKIDRSLVAGCDLHPARAEVLRMLVGFAHQHGIEVCVEGVETVGELEVARAAGATYAQGYLLGRPRHEWVDTVSFPSSPQPRALI